MAMQLPSWSIDSCHLVPSHVQASSGVRTNPSALMWVVALLLAATMPCFGLHPHQWDLHLLSAKSCSCGCVVGRWGYLRCILWNPKSMWEEGKVNYILGKYPVSVLPRKCLAVVWWIPRSDRRALAAEGGNEVCAAENSHPGMQRILWALIN